MSNRVFVPDLAALPLTPRGAPFQLSGTAMGTTWSAHGFGDVDLQRLANNVGALLNQIIAEMSQWAPDSVLSRFNHLPAGAEVYVPQAFRDVLICALEIAADTKGAFDPTLGALVDAWGFGAHPVTRAPDDDEIIAARAACGWAKLDFDVATGHLNQPGGLKLDFAGIAKGYAVDRLAAVFEESGVQSYLVEIGGEVRGAGVKPDGRPWWVEIERTPDSDAAGLIAALYNLSVATSGDYRRAGMLDGQWVSHTIDPESGRPLISPVTAVTVIHTSCMRADAYATALMIMGSEAGIAYADAHNLSAMFTLRGESGIEEHFSAAFARQLS